MQIHWVHTVRQQQHGPDDLLKKKAELAYISAFIFSQRRCRQSIGHFHNTHAPHQIQRTTPCVRQPTEPLQVRGCNTNA